MACRYRYRYTQHPFESRRFIAQDVEKVLPDVVDVPKDKDDYLSIRYTEIVPVPTKAIQEQLAHIHR